jgi:hypothetical protein
MAAGLLSMPMNLRPSALAASNVVPEPLKQSKTQSPLLVQQDTMRRSISKFFSVG